jgi:hypothetical protein
MDNQASGIKVSLKRLGYWKCRKVAVTVERRAKKVSEHDNQAGSDVAG